MHPQIILTIFRKDLHDAIRDTRVLIAILVPLGIGVLYFAIFPDITARPSASIIYSASNTALPTTIQAVLGDTVTLTITHAADPSEVHRLVQDHTVDVGLIVPPGFDAALQQGQTPTLTVLRSGSSSTGGAAVLSALDPALRQMAGQQSPAHIVMETLPSPQTGFAALLATLGLRRYFVLSSLVMLVGMITMLAVPILLAEERDKKTLDALVLVASYPEVVIAKALLGLTYITLSVILLMLMTQLVPVQALLFIGSVSLLSMALIGFGLLLGGLFTAEQLNTWGSLFLLPVILPAFFTGIPMPTVVEQIFLVLPSTHAMRLLVNSMSGQTIYPHAWASFLVLILWGIAGYGLAVWRLSRRET